MLFYEIVQGWPADPQFLEGFGYRTASSRKTGAGVEPEKPLKGSFNIRVGPELHRKLVAGASRSKMPLNRYVAELLKRSA